MTDLESLVGFESNHGGSNREFGFGEGAMGIMDSRQRTMALPINCQSVFVASTALP